MPRAKKPKKAPESPSLPRSFDRESIRGRHQSHHRNGGLPKFSRDAIDAIVDAQSRGQFRLPVQLWRTMRKEPAIYAAVLNRLAPHRGLLRDITSPTPLTGTPLAILTEAQANFATRQSVALRPSVISDDFERLAIHAVFVDQITWNPRPDGSREDPIVEPWPLEATEWSEVDRLLIATTTEGRVPIVHGDGRWIVGQHHADMPFTWGALIPLATLWPHLFTVRRDEGASAQSHGDDKWIGKLPNNIPIDSPEGRAFLYELEKLYEPQRAMVIPDGAEVKRDVSNSTNFQIFKEAREGGAKDAQRVVIGQDGTMTNTGGNYIKAWGMFGVRNDFIESDCSTVGAAYSTGLLRPWSMVNHGRWDRLDYVWLLPDADEDTRRESLASRTTAFNKAVSDYRNNGFLIDQDAVDQLAKQFGIAAPRLAQPSADQTPAVPAPSEPLSINRRSLRAAT